MPVPWLSGDDWLAGHGGRGQLRGFHDQFLSYGGPPIPLVRAQMLGGEPAATLWTPGPPAKAGEPAPATAPAPGG